MTSSNLATYSPQDVSIVISQGNNSHVVSGFAEDMIVGIERNTDTYLRYTGADNTSTRIYVADRSVKITLHLQQTSVSNAILSQLFENDRASKSSSTLFAVLVKDNTGMTLVHSTECYISRLPNSDFGNNMKIREWVIEAVDADYFIGGNSPFTPEDAAVFTALGGTIPSAFAPS